MLELYHAGLTTCSKRARHCLAEKGLDYVSHYVNLRAFENHRPEYLAINPNGVVPTLVHDGTVILESTFINEYIDEVFPDPPLRPSDPAAMSRMRGWGKMADDYGLSAVRIPTWTRTKADGVKALVDAGTLDEAIRVGKEIVEIDANDAFAHTSLSMFYQRKNLIPEAEAEAAKARMISWKDELKTNPDARPPGPAGSMDVIQ